MHSTVIGGHSGTKATYQRLKHLFQWKGMKKDMESFIQQCKICWQAKHESVHPAGLLQPLPIPQGAWQEITMDFIEGLPLSENCDTILVVVDRYTKYAHFLALKHPFTAKGVARLVMDNVVKLHGCPRTIVSDRDKVFLSMFWTELFTLLDTKLLKSSSYHPQTDGQSERVNQCLEMYLRCAVYDSPRKWKHWLSLAELWYNTSVHSSIGCSPFKALYGYDADPGTCIPTPDTPSEASDLLSERENHMLMLKEKLAWAQHKMKAYADTLRTDRQFQIGDQVLLKLQPYVQHSVVRRSFPKLSFKFFGPYRVLEKIGNTAYKLQLPEDSLIHPVFHVSQLKPFHPDHSPVFSDITKIVDLSARELQPERVLERRLVKKGNNVVPQALIKWRGLPATSATWED
jgi:hypothetical protein